MIKKRSVMDFLFYGILAFYAILMILILFIGFTLPFGGYGFIRWGRSINIVPFRQIIAYLSGGLHISSTVAFNNLLGNVVIFIPLGIYLTTLKKNKSVMHNLLLVFSISLFAEAIQYIFSLGSSDIDDLILNCLGGLIGILIYKAMLLLRKSEEKVRSLVTLLSVVVGVPIIAITVILMF